MGHWRPINPLVTRPMTVTKMHPLAVGGGELQGLRNAGPGWAVVAPETMPLRDKDFLVVPAESGNLELCAEE